jgi:hypothetical protein
VAPPARPKVAHAKGAKVTALDQVFMGEVVDHHVSWRVKRDGVDFHLQVADDELQDGDEKIEGTISYLVERNWDGVQCWMTGDALSAGHLTTHQHVREAKR